MTRLIYSLLFIGLLADCSSPKSEIYRNELDAISNWLESTKVTKDGTSIWPDAIDNPEGVSLSFSGGVAGKLIFYLQLYLDTEDPKYLAEAAAAGDYILGQLPQKTDSLQNAFWAFSPYGNVCGSAFALIELYKTTGDTRYENGANHIVDVIEHFAVNKEDTLSWDLGNDVLGGLAGTGLFMLYAGEELERPDLIEIAKKAGKTLVSRAIKDVGMTWKRGQNGRFELPNFSHGAAGIGYFFARLYEVTDSDEYLDVALQANTYLESVAKTDNDVFLIPYGFPDPGWRQPFDVGWAHGPAGVARFYRQLYKVTGDEKWHAREKQCVNGILASGIPGLPSSPDFGEEAFYLDNRFGIGSVASFLIDFENKTPTDQMLQQTLLDTILTRSVTEDERIYWPQTKYSFMRNAGDTTAFTGQFYGAAGYGMVLLKVRAKTNDTEFIRFVDDPY